MVKKKKVKKLYSNAKGLMGYGVGGMAGLGAMGAMGSIPGMPANTLTSTVGTGLNIGAIGGVAKIGLDMFSNDKRRVKKEKTNTVKKIIDRF